MLLTAIELLVIIVGFSLLLFHRRPKRALDVTRGRRPVPNKRRDDELFLSKLMVVLRIIMNNDNKNLLEKYEVEYDLEKWGEL